MSDKLDLESENPFNHANAFMPALITVAALLVCDYFLAYQDLAPWPWRYIPALTTLCLLYFIGGKSLHALGLTLTINRGARFWTKLGLAIGFVISVPAALYRESAQLSDVHFDSFSNWLFIMVIVVPILEEGIYRSALASVLRARLSRRNTVLITGALFAVLHVIYGNFSWENFISGFFLTWVYFESRTLLVPLAYHAGGNLVLGLIQFRNHW